MDRAQFVAPHILQHHLSQKRVDSSILLETRVTSVSPLASSETPQHIFPPVEHLYTTPQAIQDLLRCRPGASVGARRRLLLALLSTGGCGSCPVMAKSPVRRRQVQDPGMISTFSPFSPIIPCFLPLLPCPTVISQTSASMQTPVSSSTNSSSPKITSSAVHTSDPSFSLSSATGTQTSTSSASSPSATPDFAWMNFPASVELCSSPTFAWSYSGPRESLAFLVTANVSHSIITISSGVDSTLQFFTWHSVNISTGWYTLEASGDSVQAVSPEFTITGRDTACLITSASLFSSSTGTTSTPGTASAYIAALPSSPMTTTTLAAVSRRVSTAAIAGGAAAGVAVLIAATIGMCYLWRRAPRQRRAAVTRYNVWVERNRREVWDSLPPGTHSSGYIPAEKGDAAGLSLPRLEPNRRPPSALTDARGSRSSLLSDTMSMASLT